MAGTRRSPPAEPQSSAGTARGSRRTRIDRGAVREAVASVLAKTLPDGGRIAVALSGGRDSVVLLDAAAAVSTDAGCDVVALHVHHGLSAHAGHWQQFCRDACSDSRIAFATTQVQVAHGTRSGVEAAARAVRYDALETMAREHGVLAVLLAHHADDQAETLLLQLLRGAGPRGLAAMPAARLRDGLWWLRPLLALPRAALDAYAGEHALRYVDDDSNADPKHRRNALRATLVPALRAIAPGYPATLVRAAEQQAECAMLLDALAALDAQHACDGATLDCAALRALDPARARNILRWFLRRHGLATPSAARLEEMLRQLTRASDDAQTTLVHAGAELGVHRRRITVHRRAPERYVHEWDGAPAVELPHGTLVFARAKGGGIDTRLLASSRVTIRAGVPGERLLLAGRAGHRAVVDLLREAGIPKWDRMSLPRVYCGEALAAVPRAGIDAAFAAPRGEDAFTLDWRPREI